MLFHRYRRPFTRELFDVGRDVQRLDVAKLHIVRLAPVEKLRDGVHIGDARVLVPDVGGEKFNEAFSSLLSFAVDDFWQRDRAARSGIF